MNSLKLTYLKQYSIEDSTIEEPVKQERPVSKLATKEDSLVTACFNARSLSSPTLQQTLDTPPAEEKLSRMPEP